MTAGVLGGFSAIDDDPDPRDFRGMPTQRQEHRAETREQRAHREAFTSYLRLGATKMPDEQRNLLQRESRDIRSGGQGAYSATREFLQDDAPNIPNPLRPYLSAATRGASERRNMIRLTTKNWRDLAEQCERATVMERVDKLLRAIARKGGNPGAFVQLSFNADFPLAGASSSGELLTYLEHLQGKGLVFQSASSNKAATYKLSVAGWQTIEPQPEIGGIPSRCFVAMWVHNDVDAAYTDGIEPAVNEAGFTAHRVKEDPTNKGITDLILSEIRRAQFVVADFTGHRKSVYFETGFAQGIGREVIWCCKEDEVSDIAFDTRHLGHITWKDHADLRVQLARSIRANIIPKR